MNINYVKKIKTTNNLEVVNNLLLEDWILLKITQDGKELAYHLGYIPELNKKMASLRTQSTNNQKDL